MHKITLVTFLLVTLAVVTIVGAADEKPEADVVTRDDTVAAADGIQPRLSCYRRCLRECRGKKNKGCKGNKCICVN